MRWAGEQTYDAIVAREAAALGVPAALIKATIGIESGFNPAAINKTDPGWAWGLMQMIPATAAGLGYTGPMDALLANPALAVQLGARLLRQNLARSSGSIADSVSAYNGGFRPTLGFGATKPNGQYGNQAYVDRVLGAYQYFLGQEGGAGGAGSFRPDAPVGAGGGGGGVPDAPAAPPMNFWSRMVMWWANWKLRRRWPR